MKKNLFLITLLFMGMNDIYAQQPDSLLTNWPAGISVSGIPSYVLVDSVHLDQIKQALQDARLNEMNLRLELEAAQMAVFKNDSIKRTQQMKEIDSLRSVTQGIPVVVEHDTLYYIYTKKGSISPTARAASTSTAILKLGKSFTLEPDSIKIESSDIVTDIVYDDKFIASFTDQDALWANTTREKLAESRKSIIIEKVRELQKKYGLMQLVRRVLFITGVLILQLLLIWATNWIYRKAKTRIERLKSNELKVFSIRGYQILDTRKLHQIMVFLANLTRYLLIAIQLVISISILFSIFPQTEHLAFRMFSYLWAPVQRIGKSIVAHIPALFTIFIIWLAIRYLVKGIRYVAHGIENGRVKIPGFYPDWAQTTFHIIRFLLYAFMIAMIYPYIPGSKDGAFQGVSVFIGLIISLGSTSVIANIMAGLVITYMRPFIIGDRIKLNDVEGNVIEKTPFVTRIKTPKNEIVTIPNSFILSSHSVNYSASAHDQEHGLIIYSEASFGYEVHWSKAQEILINAALATPGVMKKPTPFVLEASLHDFYCIYQINAYIKDADQLDQIYSDLYQNIQDLSNKAGIELLSPHYYATRDGSESTIPEEYKKEEYKNNE